MIIKLLFVAFDIFDVESVHIVTVDVRIWT